MFGLALALWTAAASAQSVPGPLPNPERAAGQGLEASLASPATSLPSPIGRDIAAPAPASEPVVIGARVAEQPDRTRFVIELSDPVKLRVFTLANPDRVVVDMPEVLWRLVTADRPSGQGVVRAYRYGLFRPGDSRFVIDLAQPAGFSEPVVLPPEKGFGYRVVLDLFPTSQAKFEAAAGWPDDLSAADSAEERQAQTDSPAESTPAPSESDALQPAPLRPRVVVIDPGHGGIDSGTIGADGLQEKNLVLDEALRLKRILQKRGYLVHLTRDSDIYIPLRERVNISRGYQADLFISLHADSNPDPSVMGASVYTLSDSGSDREAAALAKKENQSDIIAGVDLSGQNSPVASILIDLAQRDTINKSARFADTLVGLLPQATDVLAREPHRSAAFVVLKAPDVPAVLVELGYLSNAHDCSQMGTALWREATAQAIAQAVDRNFGQSPAVVPVASRLP